ncbi:MAG: putative FmdB family regulatory protein [Desulforhopalus sp.]|jgi:putative FmdB family regulatory protein
MPVYEYECKACEKVIEVQQKMADAPLTNCPDCDGPISKLMSMSSFQLKGGGWYADGYSSTKDKNGAEKVKNSAEKPAPSKADSACAGCPASTST